MAGKIDVAGRIATAFDAELKKVGWKKTYPRSPSVDRMHYAKGVDRIIVDGRVYIYSGMKLEIGSDGEAVASYDGVTGLLQHEMEILQCMQRAEELVRQNG